MVSIKFISTLFIFLVLLINTSLGQPEGASGAWSLTFEDQFNGSTLDATKWNTGYTWGNTHNHRAYCAPENISIENGILRIKATNTRHPNAPNTTTSGGTVYSLDYTSGAINSNSKFNLQYGFIEGRFKAPPTLGTWPAFWLLNANGAWPPEIDILEIPGDRNTHHYYFHYGADWRSEASFGGTSVGVDKSQGYHTYGVEWAPNYIRFYFDGSLIKYYYRTEPSQGLNMYLIVNLAVGGWAGNPPSNAQFPCYFECDWIKVWKPIWDSNCRYKIINKLSGKLIEVVDANMDDGGNIKQLYDNGNDCQRWQIIDGGGKDYYWLRNLNSNKALEVFNASTEIGANISQWTYNGSSGQFWQIIDVGNGYFKIANKNSGKVIEVVGSNKDNGANIAQNNWTGSDNQLFKFVKDGQIFPIEIPTSQQANSNKSNESQVFANQSTITVKTSINSSIDIYDLNGINIAHRVVNAGITHFNLMPKGILIVKITSQKNTTSEKVLIR